MHKRAINSSDGHFQTLIGQRYSSSAQVPCNEKTLHALSWNCDRLKHKEAFMQVFSCNYFNLQSTLYVIYLGSVFSGIGLIIPYQTLAKYRIFDQTDKINCSGEWKPDSTYI